MGWEMLILALIQVLGPILVEWLKDWLERRLQQAAARIPELADYPTEDEARDALFDTAIAMTWNPLRRYLLRRLRHHAARLGVTASGVLPTLDAAAAEELAAIAGEVAEE